MTYVLYIQGDNVFVSSYKDYKEKELYGCDVHYIREHGDYDYLQSIANRSYVIDLESL